MAPAIRAEVTSIRIGGVEVACKPATISYGEDDPAWASATITLRMPRCRKRWGRFMTAICLEDRARLRRTRHPCALRRDRMRIVRAALIERFGDVALTPDMIGDVKATVAKALGLGDLPVAEGPPAHPMSQWWADPSKPFPVARR